MVINQDLAIGTSLPNLDYARLGMFVDIRGEEFGAFLGRPSADRGSEREDLYVVDKVARAFGTYR